MGSVLERTSRRGCLDASNRLPHLKALKLRVIQVQRLVLSPARAMPLPEMPSDLVQAFKHSTAFP